MPDKTAPATDPAAPETPDPEATRVASIAEQLAALKTEILGEVRQLVGAAREGGSAQHAAQQHEAGRLGETADLDQRIEAAIAKVTADQERHAAEQATQDRIGALEAARDEITPVDRSRWHKAMGWGEPAK